MEPTSLKTGVANVTLTFTAIDNMVSVYINPDGPQDNGTLGWSTVLEVNASGLAYNGGTYSIPLDPFLSNYQNAGATSVTLVVVMSNWQTGGVNTGQIAWPGDSQQISSNLSSYSSQQMAYTLVF